MRHTELVSLIALRQCHGIGDLTIKKLLSVFHSAEEIVKNKPSSFVKIPGIGTQLASKITPNLFLENANREAEFLHRNSINFDLFDAPGYPEKLKHCQDGPLLLFSRGNINLENRKIISIVGTRKVTSAGVDFCRKLIFDLAPLNPVIVSGFAYGVDIAAHQAALESGLQTIGVLAHGFNQIYPKPHRKFVSPMLENGGFITEFHTWDNPERENFVKRNRIVAGMADATVVIESAEKGGSLITANLANGYNREVFAVPGRPCDSVSVGCNNLIKTQRAHMLTQAADIIYQMNWDLSQPQPLVQKQLFLDLSADEQIVHELLVKNGVTSLDELALDSQLPVQKISTLLLQLELKGAIRSIPGKRFEAV